MIYWVRDRHHAQSLLQRDDRGDVRKWNQKMLTVYEPLGPRMQYFVRVTIELSTGPIMSHTTYIMSYI